MFVLKQVQWCKAYTCVFGFLLSAMLVLVCLLGPQQLRSTFLEAWRDLNIIHGRLDEGA